MKRKEAIEELKAFLEDLKEKEIYNSGGSIAYKEETAKAILDFIEFHLGMVPPMALVDKWLDCGDGFQHISGYTNSWED